MFRLFSPNGSHLKETSKQIAQIPAYMHYMELPFQKDLFFFFFFFLRLMHVHISTNIASFILLLPT